MKKDIAMHTVQSPARKACTRRLGRPVLAAFLLSCAAAAGAATPTSDAAARVPTSTKPRHGNVIVEAQTAGIATVGKPYTITLHVTGLAERGGKLSFTVDDTLKLTQAAPVVLPAGRPSARVTLIATPTANGLAFVNVMARQGTGGYAMSVPVQVGRESAAQKASPLPVGAAEERPPGERAVRFRPLP